MSVTSSKILTKTYGHRFCDRCGNWFKKSRKFQTICEECVEKKRREIREARKNGR